MECGDKAAYGGCEVSDALCEAAGATQSDGKAPCCSSRTTYGAQRRAPLHTRSADHEAEGPMLTMTLVLLVASSTFLEAPLPERAQRAIWEGRAARRHEVPSTDRGWASTPSSPPAANPSTQKWAEVVVELGARSIEAKLAGYEDAQQRIEASKGGELMATLGLAASAAGPREMATATPSGGAPPGLPTKEEPRAGANKAIVVAGAGAAGAALVAGVVFSVLANGKDSEVDQAVKQIGAAGDPSACVSGKFTDACTALHGLRQDYDRFVDAAAWGFIAAGVLGAGTLIYTLAAPRSAQGSGVRVMPLITTHGGGVVVSSGF
jgi:hypothetical protein